MPKKGTGRSQNLLLEIPILVQKYLMFAFDCRSDHKEVPDHSADSQQSGYSQREATSLGPSSFMCIGSPEYDLNPAFSPSTVGGWFLPGQSPICPSSSPPQFSSTGGHSSGSYCERYSSLRNHRAAPYPSHYPHRTSSTSKATIRLLVT